MDYHVRLAEPSWLEKCASPVFNPVIRQRAMMNANTFIAKAVTSNAFRAFPHNLPSIARQADTFVRRCLHLQRNAQNLVDDG